MELIPGLPNDIARHCLLRLHCTQLSTVSFVSKAWKSVIRSSEFWRHRKQLCNGNQLFLLKCRTYNMYKLIVLEPETRIWSELPLIPEFPNGLPLNFAFVIASFKRGFVVLGGLRHSYRYEGPFLYEGPFCNTVSNKVFVFDYLTGTWQRGADMPGENICVRKSTSDGDRRVYVLCNNLDNNIMEWMVYDVMKNEWWFRIGGKKPGTNLIGGSMKMMMIYQSSKIYLLDECSDEWVFNVASWKWEPRQDILKDWKNSGICVSDEGERYSYRNSNKTLAIYKDKTWKEIVQDPVESKRRFDYIAAWKSKVFTIRGILKGTDEFDLNYFFTQLEARVFYLKNHRWTTLDAPADLIANVEEGCYLEI